VICIRCGKNVTYVATSSNQIWYGCYAECHALANNGVGGDIAIYASTNTECWGVHVVVYIAQNATTTDVCIKVVLEVPQVK
jgi:hypothetical protein